MCRTSDRKTRNSSSSDCPDSMEQVDPVLKQPLKERAAHSRSLLQDPKRMAPARVNFSTRSSSCRQVCLLITCVTLIAVALSANGQQQQQAPQLPTVIVRGFLNYRTTVDGTVLLFTPDVGQSQAAASAGQPAKTSQVARLEPTSSAPHSVRSLVYTETLAQAIEPTSVPMASEAPRTVHMMSDSFRQQPTEPLAIAGDSTSNNAAAQPNEWRPIQATPPLKLAPQSTTTFKMNTDQEIVVASQPVKPSVQADDLVGESQPLPPVAPKLAKEKVGDIVSKQTEPETTRTSGRFRRPSLGFNGQGLRPRVPGTDGAVSPSLQARFRPETDSSNSSSPPPNSINGIRRPGLTSMPTSSTRSHMAPSSELAAPTNVSSAFQNRLSNANTRLRNRFKHRQPSLSSVTTTQSPVSSSAVVVASGSSSELKERNSLVAPESLLDVASSIEQPTSAARSQALVPQSDREQLSSSGPAVGSDEATISLGSQSRSNSPETSTGQEINSQAQQDQPEMVIVPVVASNIETDLAGALLEPISAEQQAGRASLSRAGEQQPGRGAASNGDADSGPRVISGQLLSGSLSSGPLNMDNIFQNDQPIASPTSMDNHAPSEPAPSHVARPNSSLSNKQTKPHNGSSMNGKLNGWLGQHHNKFVPRPSSRPSDHPNLSHQLASNLQQLAPAPPVGPFPNQSTPLSSQYETSNNNNSSLAESASSLSASNANSTSESLPIGNSTALSEAAQLDLLQTVTRTYSTIMETTRTRIVPMQVDLSTAIYTITEDFLMTKMMTAYQTLPANAVFLLADQQLSTRAPYEVFDSNTHEPAESKPKAEGVAAPPAPAIVAAPIETQEQPISLDSSPKTANNWLHDFSNLDAGLSANPLTNGFSSSTSATNQQDQQQQQAMLALLEQRAREANLAPNFSLMGSGGEQLDQLASQLDPTSLLADGAINIPDLNNPLVLAAAIQNPQLAAVILAAQQLKLKRQQQLQQKPLIQQQPQQQQQQINQLQPSFSTSFSTTIRPSTYTARDTMYTTRLVSFRDGRTVRTRTVSEPGSVVEQVLTTMVTETIPITITIKPTGVIGAGPAATSLPSGVSTSALSAQSNQATINNALFATQLANILSRRQQQLQTSFQSPSVGGLSQGLSQTAATPQQLLALQQYIGQQQQKRQQQSPQLQAQQQFQPNFQQLLQSMDSSGASATNSSVSQVPRKALGNSPQVSSSNQPVQQQATPSLQQPPKSVVSSVAPINVLSGPITTTLTSIQTKTYTVHNAFKTIFRTITSTILIPTVLNAGSTQMPTFG